MLPGLQPYFQEAVPTAPLPAHVTGPTQHAPRAVLPPALPHKQNFVAGGEGLTSPTSPAAGVAVPKDTDGSCFLPAKWESSPRKAPAILVLLPGGVAAVLQP